MTFLPYGRDRNSGYAAGFAFDHHLKPSRIVDGLTAAAEMLGQKLVDDAPTS
jgi:hypothetical protein